MRFRPCQVFAGVGILVWVVGVVYFFAPPALSPAAASTGAQEETVRNGPAVDAAAQVLVSFPLMKMKRLYKKKNDR